MSGYSFERTEHGPFVVHVTRALVGQLHLKKFRATTNAQEQRTLNLYLSGRFRVECEGLIVEYSPGDSSLDWPGIYPADALVSEYPTEPGTRVCVQPLEDGAPWHRERVAFRAGDNLEGWLLVIDGGSMLLVESFTATPTTSAIWRFSMT